MSCAGVGTAKRQRHKQKEIVKSFVIVLEVGSVLFSVSKRKKDSVEQSDLFVEIIEPDEFPAERSLFEFINDDVVAGFIWTGDTEALWVLRVLLR